ncbi:MAG: GGDEF domain-containing protein [Erysipelotrichia bacterium]|nr:GGDEF domain-containing protein [Erysipelotrichia bacterium]
MIGLLESAHFLNIGTDLFSAVLIAVLFLDDRRIFEHTYDMILFSSFELSCIVYSLADMFTWIFDGVPGSVARGAVYFFNIIFLMMQFLCFLLWMLYVRYQLNRSVLRAKSRKITAIAICFLAVLLFLTPMYNIMFSVDSANRYQSTLFTVLASGVEIILIIYASVLSFLRARHESIPDRRDDLMFQAYLMIPIFAGGILQLCLKGFSFVIPFGAVSILAMNLLSKNHRILQDPLTGLNNRGSLQRYMLALENDLKRKSIGVGMMMLDIDHFKSLNDSCGHAVGDKALIICSALLKQSFAINDIFISRYGGDEFAVIRTNVKEEDMQIMKQTLNTAMNLFNKEHSTSFELHASVGIAWSDEMNLSMNALLSKADHNLYLSKKQIIKQNAEA